MSEYGGAEYGVTSENYKTKFFEDVLEVYGYIRGQSAARICLRSKIEEYREYEMFLSDFIEMVMNNDLFKGLITGKFGWHKKGCNFGIYYVGNK